MGFFKTQEEAALIRESKLIQQEMNQFGWSIGDEEVRKAFLQIKDGLLQTRAYCVSKGYRDAARLYGDQAIKIGEALANFNQYSI
jgi:hypothetical protein